MRVLTHGSAGVAKPKRDPRYLFTGDEAATGAPPRRVPPGRRHAIRALQHALPRCPGAA